MHPQQPALSHIQGQAPALPGAWLKMYEMTWFLTESYITRLSLSTSDRRKNINGIIAGQRRCQRIVQKRCVASINKHMHMPV